MADRKVISVRPPWSHLIVGAVEGVPIKDIENRNKRTNYRGCLYIHASKTYDHEGHKFIEERMGYKLPDPDWFSCGGIIGRVTILDCVEEHESEWFFGRYGYVLAAPEQLSFEKMRGFPGLFNAPVDRIKLLVPGKTVVVNMRMDAELIRVAREQGREVVYIGRPKGKAPWGFGNPFTSKPGTKAAVVTDNPLSAHRDWLNGYAHQDVMPDVRAWQLAHLDELRGAVLVCFCKPQDCHGDYLKELAEMV